MREETDGNESETSVAATEFRNLTERQKIVRLTEMTGGGSIGELRACVLVLSGAVWSAADALNTLSKTLGAEDRIPVLEASLHMREVYNAVTRVTLGLPESFDAPSET